MIFFCFTAGTFISHVTSPLHAGVTLAGSQQLRPQGPMHAQEHWAKGKSRSKGREGANGDGNGFMTGKRMVTGMLTGTGMETGTGSGTEVGT